MSPAPSGWSDQRILQLRPARNDVDPQRPYAFFAEDELSADGSIESVATILLTNRECPFRCLMCDLWKNTTTTTVPRGAIPEQIRYALGQLAATSQVKLYNSGNFFDPAAIPVADYDAILKLLEPFRRVIVENHPRLVGRRCLDFCRRLTGQAEAAMGLETVHPEILPRLNKQMTLDDFRGASQRLREAEVDLRCFVLLKPPFMPAAEAVPWALESLRFAFDCGVECASVVPTRGGNGAMESLAAAGDFSPPSLRDLEEISRQGIALRRGRVFVDLWDIEKLFDCRHCGPARRERLRRHNLTQRVQPPVACGRCGAGGVGLATPGEVPP